MWQKDFTKKNSQKLFFSIIHREFAIGYFLIHLVLLPGCKQSPEKHKYYSHLLEKNQHQALVLGMVQQ